MTTAFAAQGEGCIFSECNKISSMSVGSWESREVGLKCKIPEEIIHTNIWKRYVFLGSGTTALLPGILNEGRKELKCHLC